MGSNIFLICLCAVLYDTYLAFGTSALSCFRVPVDRSLATLLRSDDKVHSTDQLQQWKQTLSIGIALHHHALENFPIWSFKSSLKILSLIWKKLFPFCTPRTRHNAIKLMIQSKDAFIHLYVNDYTAHIQRVTTLHANSVCYRNGGLCWEDHTEVENKDLHSPPPYESIHSILLAQTWAWSSWKFKSHNTENAYLLTGQTHSLDALHICLKELNNALLLGISKHSILTNQEILSIPILKLT